MQDGGPKGTRHEGFKDAQVFLRGNSQAARQDRAARHSARPDRRAPGPVRITRAAAGAQLADWLAEPDNPLTPRVMVNRIWQHHFGEGLVRTPNDFGERGERPTQPGAARLPGRALRRVGMVGEGDAPAHHAVVGLPAEQRADGRRARPRTRTTASSGG